MTVATSQAPATATTHLRQRMMLVVCALVSMAALSGCSAYQLQGTVISGERPAVLVVDSDDPRLTRPGIMGAELEFVVDPNRMSPKPLGVEFADDDGKFAKPVDVAGAGFLEYDLGVMVRAPGYRNLWQTLPMPGGNKRLLVIMAEGEGGTGPAPDVLQETLKQSEHFMNR